MKRLRTKIVNLQPRNLRYIVGSIWNTLVGVVAFPVIYFEVGNRLSPVTIIVLSNIVALLNHYLVHCLYSFQQRPSRRSFWRSIVIQIIALLGNIGFCKFFSLDTRPDFVWIQIVIGLVLAAVVYLVNNYFVFAE